MTVFSRPWELILSQIGHVIAKAGFKFSRILIVASIIGLGILLGYLFSSFERADVTTSILVILLVLVIIIHKPLHGLLLWVFLEPFIETWVKIDLGGGIPDLSFSRFIIAFLAIVMLAKASVGEFRFKRLSLTELCIVATPIGIIISAPLSQTPLAVVQLAISVHLTPLLAYFFAKNLIRDKTAFNKLFLVIVLFGFVAAIYAIYEQSTGHILFLPRGQLANQLWTDYTENLRLIRGLLERAGNFGRVFTVSIPISFYLFFESKSAKQKTWLVVMLIVQFYGLFLTYNRTSWYALMISLFIIQFFYPQFRNMFVVMIFVGIVTLWATWDQVNQSTVVEERINSKESTLEGREQLWQAAYNMWLAKPVWGWGFGRYEEESGRFRTDGKRTNLKVIENDYLHILVGSGLIGLLPYMLSILVPLFKSVPLFFKARAPDWSGFINSNTITIYWAVIISFMITSYTQIQNQAVVKLLPFVVAGAVIGTHEHLLRRQKTKQPASLHSPQVTPVPTES